MSGMYNKKKIVNDPVHGFISIPSELQFDIMQHPRTGLGHPEPLIGGEDITYSRHITAHDRIIYDIYDEHVSVLVIQVEEHYDDK